MFTHRFDVGDCQVNAVGLTAALGGLHGHDVLFFATPGPMVKLVEEKGLRFLPAPNEYGGHPSLARRGTMRTT